MLDLLPEIWHEQRHASDQRQESGLMAQLVAKLGGKKGR